MYIIYTLIYTYIYIYIIVIFAGAKKLFLVTRNAHEKSKEHRLALGEGKHQGMNPPVVCTGIVISSGPGQQSTLLGGIWERVRDWYVSGCIGVRKSVLEELIVAA